jgi:hypothetical protein
LRHMYMLARDLELLFYAFPIYVYTIMCHELSINKNIQLSIMIQEYI